MPKTCTRSRRRRPLRYEGDGMELTWPVKNPPREKLEEYAAQIRGKIV
jgi:hypothetical protein